ncbi:hypothetical protein XENORESO_015310 [Xenotaenia resolanae]|uniref:Uncharacterized protein n=1 Tax=Xenotaenia resolanae TaxID=208358 RepID=A0ABV0WUP3_9TELE
MVKYEKWSSLSAKTGVFMWHLLNIEVVLGFLYYNTCSKFSTHPLGQGQSAILTPDQPPIPFCILCVFSPFSMMLSLNIMLKFNSKGLQANTPQCSLVELLTPFGSFTIDIAQHHFTVTLE